MLGGAYSVDKPYRLMRGWSWFEDEQPSDEIKADAQRRLDELDWKVDLVLSHTCPAEYIPHEAMMSFVDQSTVDRSTEDWLDGIEDRLQYDAWYCGHWHINKRIDRMHFLFHELAWLPEKREVQITIMPATRISTSFAGCFSVYGIAKIRNLRYNNTKSKDTLNWDVCYHSDKYERRNHS